MISDTARQRAVEMRAHGHAFVVMLAYSIIHALAALWRDLDLTVQEGLDQFATLCLTEVLLPDARVCYQLRLWRDNLGEQPYCPRMLPAG